MLLRTKELLDAEDISKLQQRWEGPFTVTACPSPNAYTLAGTLAICLGGVRNYAWQQFPRNCCHTIL